MKKFCSILLVVTLIFNFIPSAFALEHWVYFDSEEEMVNTTMKFSINKDGISSEKVTVDESVDNSNLMVKVIQPIGNGETREVYRGPMSGLKEGAWQHVDYSKIWGFAVLIKNPDSLDVLYIVPIRENEEHSVGKNMIQTDETTRSSNSTIQASLNDIELDVSLLYENSYSERVMKQGEELTAEIIASNVNNEENIDITVVVAMYSNEGKLINVKNEAATIAPKDITTLQVRTVVPLEEEIGVVKIFIWDNMTQMLPYKEPIVLTAESNDYFGDDFLFSQTINGKNKANGKINGVSDTDVFSFTPQNDGLYYFETLSDIDAYASLYEESNVTIPISSDDNSGADNNFRLSATLKAGTTYYLYMNGRTTGQYTLNYGYSIGNVFGTVSPVKYYDDDTEFNSAIEATVDLNTFYTGEFVATMHLKDWGVSNNEYASYSMTGVHSGDYLVKTKRPGYLTHYQKISLIDNAIDLGNVTLIPGDVNGDDVINNDDLNIVNNLSGSEYGSESYISSADINSDKIINSEDVSLVNANMNKTSNEYGGNVNVIFINAETHDSQLIVSGNAAPNSDVNCVVFYDGYSIYEGETTCSADGTLEFVIDLNRSGDYTILVTSDNQAYEITKTIAY